jgi:hypothetical protein
MPSWAGLQDDCYQEMDGGNKRQAGQFQYISSDSVGIKEYCKTGFPSSGERFILKRTGTDPFDTLYTVRRSYCWAMNGFDSWSCQWPTGPAWGDDYSASFDVSDIKTPDDSVGKKALRSGSGLNGHYVCLKRYAPGQQMKHGGTNTTKHNLICGYTVFALMGDACQSPWGGWNAAYFGCVEEPLKYGPQTYNVSIPAGLMPYVDPNVELEDTKDDRGNLVQGYLSMGSTFDQPLIKIINGYDNAPLVLRFRYDDDSRFIDNRPICSAFPNQRNGVYCAKIADSDPSKVCVCEKNLCNENSFLGCVDRPTPRQSNLAIIAEYIDYPGQEDAGGAPAVSPAFALTDSNGDVIYYDSKGAAVYFDKDGNAFKRDSSGKPTSDPAEGRLIYNKLPMPKNPIPIRENSEQKTQGNKFTFYKKDMGKVYGVEFTAIIPQFLSDKKTIFSRALETPYTRQTTDGCGALALAKDPNDPNKPRFYVPAGSRDRTFCACPEGADPRSCAVPPETKCYNGRVEYNDPEAAKIYCPGKFVENSDNAGGGKICLQLSSSWGSQGVSLLSDKDIMCADIPNKCKAVKEPVQTSGFSVWPQQEVGNKALGSCLTEGGFQERMEYTIDPVAPIERAKFNCSALKTGANCDETYNLVYLPAFKSLTNDLGSMQLAAYSENRNLSKEDIQKLDFNTVGNLHKLAAALLNPARECKANTNQGVVENGCMIKNSCDSISSVNQLNGYAYWVKVRDLNESEKKTASTSEYTFNITMEGTCPAGYKEGDAKPNRKCLIKYRNGERIFEKWQDPVNPCIKQN